jgi:hypothetical protein
VKRLAAIALLVTACGGDAPVQVDAEPLPDAEPCLSQPMLSACNAVDQTGCEADQKCTWQYDTDRTGRPACVPAGTVAVGEACTFLPPGQTGGYDDCVGGAFCHDGVCKVICTVAPNSCEPFETVECVHYEGAFDCMDVVTGVCEPLS